MIKKLTHTLEYDKWHNKWFCKCGYVLGTGHEALYALCPLREKKRGHESMTTLHRKTRKKRLTRKQAMKYDKVREQVALEFTPTKKGKTNDQKRRSSKRRD